MPSAVRRGPGGLRWPHWEPWKWATGLWGQRELSDLTRPAVLSTERARYVLSRDRLAPRSDPSKLLKDWHGCLVSPRSGNVPAILYSKLTNLFPWVAEVFTDPFF